MDLRERALAMSDEGLKTGQVAKRLKVSTTFVRDLKRKRRKGESLEARLPGGPKYKLDEGARAALAGKVEKTPDATLEELRTWIASELKISISIGALWNTLRDMKLTLKKSRSMPANSRVWT